MKSMQTTILSALDYKQTPQVEQPEHEPGGETVDQSVGDHRMTFKEKPSKFRCTTDDDDDTKPSRVDLCFDDDKGQKVD